MRILVVDDNPKHREAAQLQLGGSHELTVLGSISEVEARSQRRLTAPKLNAYRYDVVLTDLMMPDPGDQKLAPIGLGIANKALIMGAKVGILSMGHDTMTAKWATDVYEIPGKLWAFIDENCPRTEDGLSKNWVAALEKILSQQ